MGGNHKNNNMLQKNCRLTDSLWITWDSKDIHLQKSSKEIRFELLSEPLGCCGCRKRTNLSSRCEADVSEENLSTQYRVGLWVFHHLTSNVTLHWIYSWIPAISIYSRKKCVSACTCACVFGVWMNSSQHRNQLWAEMNCGR